MEITNCHTSLYNIYGRRLRERPCLSGREDDDAVQLSYSCTGATKYALAELSESCRAELLILGNSFESELTMR
jgi:hypothetical protein